MKLIVGLGNIGEQYTHTRHNVGFLAIDALAIKFKAPTFSEESKFNGLSTKVTSGDEQIVLVKPTTLMNLSGNAVSKYKQFYKLDNDDIWVISDDFEIPLGKVRVRRGGSSGGQNGLGSIISAISDDFWRIRIGIGSDRMTHQDASSFVLSGFDKEEKTQLEAIIKSVTNLITDSLGDTIEHVSHNFL